MFETELEIKETLLAVKVTIIPNEKESKSYYNNRIESVMESLRQDGSVQVQRSKEQELRITPSSLDDWTEWEVDKWICNVEFKDYVDEMLDILFNPCPVPKTWVVKYLNIHF